MGRFYQSKNLDHRRFCRGKHCTCYKPLLRLCHDWSEVLFLLLLKMLEGKGVVRETDMSEEMKSYVIESAHQALDAHQKRDEAYGPAWNSVVGKDFRSCITHLCASFIFFRVKMMEFLIFKDGKDFAESREEAIGVLQKARYSDS
ncbi:Dynein light chain 1, cytoplasmic, partial [Mucuna pruriens]